jgi:Fasciclin domain
VRHRTFAADAAPRRAHASPDLARVLDNGISHTIVAPTNAADSRCLRCQIEMLGHAALAQFPRTGRLRTRFRSAPRSHAALTHAGLELDNGVNYTIFAPTNDAIAAIGADSIAALKQDKELLTLVRRLLRTWFFAIASLAFAVAGLVR